jgi:carbon monoxide dehydrogenase subunit G
MKLTNEFVIRATVEEVWPLLLDIERVAPCLPGASITDNENGEHHGVIEVRLGPITARYKGVVAIESADEAAREVVMRARGKDARGQGTATARIKSALTAIEDGTQVVVETDLQISGPVAQIGRGVMQSVSAKMMSEFASRLARELGGKPQDQAGGTPASENQVSHRPAFDSTDATEQPGQLARLRESGTSGVLTVAVLVAGVLALLVSRRQRQ